MAQAQERAYRPVSVAAEVCTAPAPAAVECRLAAVAVLVELPVQARLTGKIDAPHFGQKETLSFTSSLTVGTEGD